ncbi:uncharacterized protein LOC119691688 [Plutella xylostella]|uniref:uncharacterized protein LOC119691688 n=1 Tax=Plutella xylostella TaxID=51655 RepID=UPI00203229CC|nr:uncharacterized protein LOC119691688 [Plutella xylostella]
MAPASKLGRGKPLKSQTKEVLNKIHRYFESEIERDPNSTVTAAQLVVHSTGISMNALKRVLAEYKTRTTVKKEYNKTRRRCKKNFISDDFDAQSIRRIIHNFYTKEEEFPIMKDLYLILKADMDYQGSLCTLRRHVAKLGFRWVETEDNNSILIEKQDFRYVRIQYLTKVEAYRSQGRNIVYTGDTTIESSRMSSKPKPDGTSTVLKQPAKSKLVTLLAGDLQGILKNTLYIFDSSKRDVKEEDNKNENYFNHEKWFRYHLLPSLKPNSIVIVDGGLTWHNRLVNPTPHSNSRKKDMMDWLTSRSVPHSSNMYKAQLYQLILLHKDKFSDYKIDALLREHGHTVLRLPPHHPDLNPIKTVLSSVKEYIGTDISLKLESVLKIAKEKLSSIEPEEWKQTFRLAEAEENSLKATEMIIDEISERTFKNIDEETGESEIEDDNGSEQESMDSD